ncbi:hypothetical protein [Tenggerimyces flavus]|uniref:Dihydrofolate reductase n=1 Tax=Tenggerimyces flavus TaxID=1708749 RepID=A0ABV7Y4U6_9ACTN|nr:hypothetical protein [Tenggerimyces flavus]MBM7790519.1 hypothetical protein [Tenggerimyces flavus]
MTTRGKVVWGTSMSLDGFVAGPDHAMGWMAADWLPPAPPSELAKDLAGEIGLRYRVVRS